MNRRPPRGVCGDRFFPRISPLGSSGGAPGIAEFTGTDARAARLLSHKRRNRGKRFSFRYYNPTNRDLIQLCFARV
jgi:hypothetical protein